MPLVSYVMPSSIDFSTTSGLADSAAPMFTVVSYSELSQERIQLMPDLSVTERRLENLVKRLRSARIERQALVDTVLKLWSEKRESKEELSVFKSVSKSPARRQNHLPKSAGKRTLQCQSAFFNTSVMNKGLLVIWLYLADRNVSLTAWM